MTLVTTMLIPEHLTMLLTVVLLAQTVLVAVECILLDVTCVNLCLIVRKIVCQVSGPIYEKNPVPYPASACGGSVVTTGEDQQKLTAFKSGQQFNVYNHTADLDGAGLIGPVKIFKLYKVQAPGTFGVSMSSNM